MLNYYLIKDIMDLFLIGQWLAVLIAGENSSVVNQCICVWTCKFFGGSEFLIIFHGPK